MLCKEELSEVSRNWLKVEVMKGSSDKVSNDSEEVLFFLFFFKWRRRELDFSEGKFTVDEIQKAGN